jgi:hypothetical protein
MSNVAAELDALRIAAGRTEAFASIAVQLYDNGAGSGSDQVQSERVAYLLGAVAEAAAGVVAVVDRFSVLVADQQPAEGGDNWVPEGSDDDRVTR